MFFVCFVTFVASRGHGSPEGLRYVDLIARLRRAGPAVAGCPCRSGCAALRGRSVPGRAAPRRGGRLSRAPCRGCRARRTSADSARARSSTRQSPPPRVPGAGAPPRARCARSPGADRAPAPCARSAAAPFRSPAAISSTPRFSYAFAEVGSSSSTFRNAARASSCRACRARDHAEAVVGLGIVGVRGEHRLEQRGRLVERAAFLQVAGEHDHHALVGDAAPDDAFERRDRAGEIAGVALHRGEHAVRGREVRVRRDDRADRANRCRARALAERRPAHDCRSPAAGDQLLRVVRLGVRARRRDRPSRSRSRAPAAADAPRLSSALRDAGAARLANCAERWRSSAPSARARSASRVNRFVVSPGSRARS